MNKSGYLRNASAESLKLPWFVEELIGAGVRVTILRHEDQKPDEALNYYFDLNLQAKSHLHLHLRFDQQWEARMRYDYETIVETLDDLIFCARRGMHGREYIDPAWARLIEVIES